MTSPVRHPAAFHEHFLDERSSDLRQQLTPPALATLTPTVNTDSIRNYATQGLNYASGWGLTGLMAVESGTDANGNPITPGEIFLFPGTYETDDPPAYNGTAYLNGGEVTDPMETSTLHESLCTLLSSPTSTFVGFSVAYPFNAIWPGAGVPGGMGYNSMTCNLAYFGSNTLPQEWQNFIFQAVAGSVAGAGLYTGRYSHGRTFLERFPVHAVYTTGSGTIELATEIVALAFQQPASARISTEPAGCSGFAFGQDPDFDPVRRDGHDAQLFRINAAGQALVAAVIEGDSGRYAAEDTTFTTYAPFIQLTALSYGEANSPLRLVGLLTPSSDRTEIAQLIEIGTLRQTVWSEPRVLAVPQSQSMMSIVAGLPARLVVSGGRVDASDGLQVFGIGMDGNAYQLYSPAGAQTDAVSTGPYTSLVAGEGIGSLQIIGLTGDGLARWVATVFGHKLILPAHPAIASPTPNPFIRLATGEAFGTLFLIGLDVYGNAWAVAHLSLLGTAWTTGQQLTGIASGLPYTAIATLNDDLGNLYVMALGSDDSVYVAGVYKTGSGWQSGYQPPQT